MTALDTLDPYASKEELDREDLLAIGRAHFDANGWTELAVSPWRPGNREEYARAYAEIARPFGPRKGASQ